MDHTGASWKSPRDAPWNKPNQRLRRPITEYPWHCCKRRRGALLCITVDFCCYCTFGHFSHDISVWELMYFIVCPPCGQGSHPGHGRIFWGIVPWLITLCQPVLSQRGRKWLNHPSMAPHNLDIKEGGRSSTMDRRWVKEKHSFGLWTHSCPYISYAFWPLSHRLYTSFLSCRGLLRGWNRA